MFTSTGKSAHGVGPMGSTNGCNVWGNVWGRWAQPVLVHNHVAINTSSSFGAVISGSGARRGSHSWEVLVRNTSPGGGLHVGIVDGDIACYRPWLSRYNHGRIWFYSYTGALLCASDTVCNTGREFQQGDTIRVALDLEWRGPLSCSPSRGGSGVGERGGGESDGERGRVDFYKNGQHVGGMALKGWSGEGPLFAGGWLLGVGDSVEMLQRQALCLPTRGHRRSLARPVRVDGQAWSLEISDHSDKRRWEALRDNLRADGKMRV